MRRRQTVWVIVAIAAVASLAWVLSKLNGATVYRSHDAGFSAYTLGSASAAPRAVSAERFERVLERFVRGDLFDGLSVHRQGSGDQGGVGLFMEGGRVEASISFLRLKEPERVAAFRDRMAAHGYTTTDETEWNVGMGIDLDSVTLDYELPRRVEDIRLWVWRALEAEAAEPVRDVAVVLWSSKDGPGDSGIRIVPHRDYLREVP
jgi:hypothetical protein